MTEQRRSPDLGYEQRFLLTRAESLERVGHAPWEIAEP